MRRSKAAIAALPVVDERVVEPVDRDARHGSFGLAILGGLQRKPVWGGASVRNLTSAKHNHDRNAR